MHESDSRFLMSMFNKYQTVRVVKVLGFWVINNFLLSKSDAIKTHVPFLHKLSRITVNALDLIEWGI